VMVLAARRLLARSSPERELPGLTTGVRITSQLAGGGPAAVQAKHRKARAALLPRVPASLPACPPPLAARSPGGSQTGARCALPPQGL
jgi:hypothetical protein